MYEPKPFEAISDEDWMAMIETNFMSGVRLSRYYLPKMMAKNWEFFGTVRPSSLLKRFAPPDEVAALVAFVASPLSSATNGAALRVDGGVVRSIL